MSLASIGRPTRPREHAGVAGPPAGRGLLQDEPLIFELGGWDKTGVDFAAGDELLDATDLAGLTRASAPDLPGLSEPEALRHYVRLSQKNHAIDLALYPLGSCTMKHNPRLDEKMARLPGFADVHPLQPQSTVQVALAVMDELAHWLKTLTGMPAVGLSPKAGAHGELCGLLAIRAAHEAKGDARKTVLVPTSAHGTNPASAAQVGYAVREIAQTADGRVDLEDLAAQLGPDVAAVMVTNPNTCGLFERDVLEISRLTHAAGAYFYCDGANFNAIVGRVRPADLGVDAMHINLHKTFSTPHGGGGPGAGPVVLSAALAPYAPTPWLVHDGQGLRLEEQADRRGERRRRAASAPSTAQMGMYVRALAYMMSHEARRAAPGGRRRRAERQLHQGAPVRRDEPGRFRTARACTKPSSTTPGWKAPVSSTLDFAKAMIDAGFHPMTMYFPLVVHGSHADRAH